MNEQHHHHPNGRIVFTTATVGMAVGAFTIIGVFFGSVWYFSKLDSQVTINTNRVTVLEQQHAALERETNKLRNEMDWLKAFAQKARPEGE